MKVKFEEKTYENYFNTELDSQTEIYFPLGQVQEGFLGFDSAAASHNRRLWSRFGYFDFPFLAGVPLNEIEHFMGAIVTDLPPFKANLLFQYKRPEFIKIANGSEWPNWNQPYYRYDIYQEQQELLMCVHQEFNGRLLILYAAPAIHDVNDLVRRKMSRQIIEFSNFQHCHNLNGHHRNTYIEAGTYSIACSEPENIEKVNLLDLLNQFDNFSKQDDNRSFIINFRRQIESIVSNDNYYGLAFKNIIQESAVYNEQYPLLQSFRVMRRFKEITGIQWLIKL